MFETKSRTVPITQQMVKNAYQKVKSNGGSAGVDGESLAEYQLDLQNNLYKLWNRLSSGSYFPQEVREVEIPKASGGTRALGIPTVSDRIAQQVIKHYLEPRLEAEFSKNSYGYRPLKSAHDAVQAVRENTWQFAWVVDMDIKSFFNEVDHELMMKALERHVEENWVKVYIKRWLESPSINREGKLTQKEGRGTPQGGVISPLISNLYLHYALDKWLEKYHPCVTFVRYADDVVIHCSTEAEAKKMLAAVRERLQECKLRLNEEKTKLVQCKYFRKEKRNYKRKFDFLGFTFKPEYLINRDKIRFMGYGFTMSSSSRKRILANWKLMNWSNNTTLDLQGIAALINTQMRGIMRYYGKFSVYALRSLIHYFHRRLMRWAIKKYKSFKGSIKKVFRWLKEIRISYPNLFYHWTVLTKAW